MHEEGKGFQGRKISDPAASVPGLKVTQISFGQNGRKVILLGLSKLLEELFSEIYVLMLRTFHRLQLLER